MPVDDNGVWYPDLFDKQLDVYNSYARALLICGPRLCGKTIGVLHRLLRHMWETDRARVAMFSRTIKNSKDGGPWMKLHRDIIPEWLKSGIGFRYTTMNSEGRPGFKVDGQTRTMFFRIRNRYGTESECMLFSLDYDHDVESKLKEMEFSMIYFSELSKFGDRSILSMSLPSLRMLHLKFDQQMWISDTNPSEEGESSWIYRVWYQERLWSYIEYCLHNKEVGLPVMPEATFTNFQNSLQLIEWGIKENPRLDQRQVEEVVSACGYDIGLYARLVEGKWVFGDGDRSRHFRGYFLPNIHVVGNCDSANSDEWICANPHAGAYELITGWDLGETNHAACIIDRVMVNGIACFVVVDELVYIGKDVAIDTFSEEFMEMIEDHERRQKKTFGLENAWSDRSSIEKYSATGDTYPYLIVHAATGGRIFLQGVPKAPRSVRVRVDLLKSLLKAKRFKVSAHCNMTIQMLHDLKRGRPRSGSFVVEDENKHAFDCITYALLMECSREMEGKDYGSADTRPLAVQVG